MEGEGFYKKINNEWFYAPNGCIFPGTDKICNSKKEMAKQDWVWCDTAPTEYLKQVESLKTEQEVFLNQTEKQINKLD